MLAFGGKMSTSRYGMAASRAIVEKQAFADVRRCSENRQIIHVMNEADIILVLRRHQKALAISEFST